MNSGDSREVKVGKTIRLAGSAIELVALGKREPDALADFLQQFVFGASLGLDLWVETYKALGLESEFRQVDRLVFPEDKNLWFLPMVPGVTSNKIVAGHRRFGVNYWLYADDLDVSVPTHDRDANRDGPYIVGFRRNVEADEEFAGKSVNVLVKAGHKGICLPERLLLGAGYHVATGQHLDVKTATLCAGSHSVGGIVPHVDWSSGNRKVYVNHRNPDNSDGSLRSRSAVSYVSCLHSKA